MAKWIVTRYKKHYGRDIIDYFDNEESAKEWYNRLLVIYPDEKIALYEQRESKK